MQLPSLLHRSRNKNENRDGINTAANRESRMSITRLTKPRKCEPETSPRPLPRSRLSIFLFFLSLSPFSFFLSSFSFFFSFFVYFLFIPTALNMQRVMIRATSRCALRFYKILCKTRERRKCDVLPLSNSRDLFTSNDPFKIAH